MVVDSQVRAGVIWGGVVGSYEDLIDKWPSYWEKTNSPIPSPRQENPQLEWRSYLLDTYGSPKEHPDKWKEISATTYLSDISGPLQLHHAYDDEWVPVVL